MPTTVRDYFDGYLNASNAHDPAAVARYMADDAIYEDVALKPRAAWSVGAIKETPLWASMN